MLGKNGLVVIATILVIYYVQGINSSKDGGIEKVEYFISRMTEALHYIHLGDRTKFMKKCSSSLARRICPSSTVGDTTKSYVRWADGIGEDSKARFWSSYICYMHKNLELCPVDGSWTTWSEWEDCTVECGDKGEVKRTRACENPIPRNSGNICEGINTEKKMCQGICDKEDKKTESQLEAFRYLEKVHNNYTILKSLCLNQHCTYEQLGTIITATNIKDKYWSSLHCYKYRRACPVDGNWSPWNLWSKCSSECGDGFTYRIRYCDHPAPANTGYECLGEFYEEQTCVGNICNSTFADQDIDPLLSEWSKYTPCSVTCGKYGTAVQNRKCLTPKDCLDLLNTTEIKREKPCYNGPCPYPGQWTEWTAFTGSSAVCGLGRATRYRSCKPGSDDGSFCVGKSVERTWLQGNCTEKELEELNLRMISTQENKTDSKGSITRFDIPPPDDVIIVPLNLILEKTYTEWSPWTKCTKTCSTGVRQRFRDCKKEKGLNCKGERWQFQPCNVMHCPENGEWGGWESWTTCSVTCGSHGTQQRYRKCDRPYPRNGGTCLGISEETVPCSANRTCDSRISYSDWSSWTQCSKSCSIGNKLRTRTCKVPNSLLPKFGMKNEYCKKANTEAVSVCNAKPCPTNGNWGNWNSWSSCSSVCGNGHHFRDRTCTFPAPMNNGKPCFGPGSDIMACFKIPCTVPIHEGVTLNNGFIFYDKSGRHTGYFSLYMQFKPKTNHNGRLLLHNFDGCISLDKCRSSLEIILMDKKIKVSLNLTGSLANFTTDDNSIQMDEWHSLYLHLSDEKVFLRADDGKKYERQIKPSKVNFDGYSTIGLFTGQLSSLRINLKEYSFRKANTKQYAYPRKTSADNKVNRLNSESVDAVVGHSIFHGNSFIKIPIGKTNRLTVMIVFCSISPNGILLFNGGQTAGSYIYLVISNGALKFCGSDSKKKTCETIFNINVYTWYTVMIDVNGNKADIRLNNGSATQISFPDKPYTPVGHVCIGGGEKPDRFLFDMIVGMSNGFSGVVHEVTVNGEVYNIYFKPIINDEGVLSSFGITAPERVTEIYEHQRSIVNLQCDYTRYIMKGQNTTLEWFREDALVKLDAGHKINRKIPGKNFVSELTLLPSKNQTGLYACAVNQNGVFTVLHVFILIRHNIVIEYFAEDMEFLALTFFLILTIILFICCVLIAVIYRLREIKYKKLKTIKSQIIKDNVLMIEETGFPGDGGTDMLPEKCDSDTSGLTDELDATGRTDELDTTGQTEELEKTTQTDDLEKTTQTDDLEKTTRTDDLDKTDQTEELDTTGQTEELDTTGQTEELDTTDQAEELDTTGQTEELDTTGQTEELDTTGQTEELDTTGQTDDLDTTDQTDQSESGDESEDGETVVHLEDKKSGESESDEEVIHYDRKESLGTSKQSQQKPPSQLKISKGSVHWPQEYQLSMDSASKTAQHGTRNDIGMQYPSLTSMTTSSRPPDQNILQSHMSSKTAQHGPRNDIGMQYPSLTSMTTSLRPSDQNILQSHLYSNAQPSMMSKATSYPSFPVMGTSFQQIPSNQATQTSQLNSRNIHHNYIQSNNRVQFRSRSELGGFQNVRPYQQMKPSLVTKSQPELQTNQLNRQASLPSTDNSFLYISSSDKALRTRSPPRILPSQKKSHEQLPLTKADIGTSQVQAASLRSNKQSPMKKADTPIQMTKTVHLDNASHRLNEQLPLIKDDIGTQMSKTSQVDNATLRSNKQSPMKKADTPIQMTKTVHLDNASHRSNEQLQLMLPLTKADIGTHISKTSQGEAASLWSNKQSPMRKADTPIQMTKTVHLDNASHRLNEQLPLIKADIGTQMSKTSQVDNAPLRSNKQSPMQKADIPIQMPKTAHLDNSSHRSYEQLPLSKADTGTQMSKTSPAAAFRSNKQSPVITADVPTQVSETFKLQNASRRSNKQSPIKTADVPTQVSETFKLQNASRRLKEQLPLTKSDISTQMSTTFKVEVASLSAGKTESIGQLPPPPSSWTTIDLRPNTAKSPRKSAENKIVLPPAGSPSPPKPATQTVRKTLSMSISPSKMIPSPQKLVSPQTHEDTPPPSPPIMMPFSSNFESADDIPLNLVPSEDNISIHSLLSINHKSTSKIENISISSVESLNQDENQNKENSSEK